MTAEEAVCARLLDITAVTNIVDERIYLDEAPQKPRYPLIVVQLVEEPSAYHLRGGWKDRARVQVDAYVQKGSGIDASAAAMELADAINGDDAGSGLSAWSGEIGSPPFLITGILRIVRVRHYEPDELRVERQRQDYWVHFRR